MTSSFDQDSEYDRAAMKALAIDVMEQCARLAELSIVVPKLNEDPGAAASRQREMIATRIRKLKS